MSKNINNYNLHHIYTYAEYSALMQDYAASGKTTGPESSEMLIHFSKLNASRVKRLNRNSEIYNDIAERIKDIDRQLDFYYITESWCGDAAQILPVVQAIVDEIPTAESSVVLRDDNPELMSDFLTDGGKSIPIIIITEAETGNILGHWGPRPREIQTLVIERKYSDQPEPYETFSARMQEIYRKDKGKMIQQQFTDQLLSVL